MTIATLPAPVQQFFTDRLWTEIEASANTISGYRDTFDLLLPFASERTGRAATKLRIENIDSEPRCDAETFKVLEVSLRERAAPIAIGRRGPD